MKIKVSEATNLQLDWLVGSALGDLGLKPMTCSRCRHHEERAGRDDPVYYCHHPKSRHETDYGWGDAISPDYGTHPECPISDLTPEPYTTDWSYAGPIIERQKIGLREPHEVKDQWYARITTDVTVFMQCGPTPLIAAMRCFEASRLGDEVEIPENLK